MTETRNNEMLAKMMEDPALDADFKEFLERLHEDEDGPSDLLKSLLSGDFPSDLLKHLLDDDEVSEEKECKAVKVFEDIKAFIEGNKWKASIIDPENKVFILGFSMRNTSLRVMVRVDAEAESICCNTTLPITCMEEYRMLMGSKLNQMNESLRYGAFRLDEDDGEITYRFTYSYSGQDFNAKMFDNYLDCCLITPDLQYKKIAKIATGSLSKEEKVQVLESLKMLAKAINA